MFLIEKHISTGLVAFAANLLTTQAVTCLLIRLSAAELSGNNLLGKRSFSTTRATEVNRRLVSR